MSGIYYGEWALSGLNGLMNNFSVSEQELQGVHVVLAGYDCGSYEGDAFVLFEKSGKLYEVYGSHCSCYGLEGQWEPEEVLLEELIQRVHRDSYRYTSVKEPLIEILRLCELVGVDTFLVTLRLSSS